MVVREAVKKLQSKGGVNHAALTMAVAVLMDRISKLPKEDRDDLFELAKELSSSEGSTDEQEEIVASMLEILEQEPIKVRALNVTKPIAPTEAVQTWMDYVGNQIKSVREAAKLSQEELARRTGLPQSHISRLENKKHSPSRATLERIAAALKVPLLKLDPSAE